MSELIRSEPSRWRSIGLPVGIVIVVLAIGATAAFFGRKSNQRTTVTAQHFLVTFPKAPEKKIADFEQAGFQVKREIYDCGTADHRGSLHFEFQEFPKVVSDTWTDRGKLLSILIRTSAEEENGAITKEEVLTVDGGVGCAYDIRIQQAGKQFYGSHRMYLVDSHMYLIGVIKTTSAEDAEDEASRLFASLERLNN